MTADGFERFAEAHAGAFARLAYQLTGHREAARDLVQDVLLDVYRHWPRIATVDNQPGYVRKMLVNRHLSTVRKHRVKEYTSSGSYEALAGRDDEPAPSSVLADHDAVWRALAGLTDRQRAVLVLRYYEGLGDPAIATVVGCRRSTVRSLAARGLTLLKNSPHLVSAESPPTRSLQ